jgi:hypothetical protein
MPAPENAMQVFALLEKTNCKKCGEKTCLAFAGAVYKGERNISECPYLSADIVARFSGDQTGNTVDERRQSAEQLRQRISTVDFRDAAERTGGVESGARLTVKVLGKDFSVDRQGNLFSDIHIIPWVTEPFLTYVLTCRGEPLTGKWMSMRELDGGKERYPLFRKRGEEAMKRVADVYTDLFDDMAHLFQGRQVDSRFDSDISVILPVFPNVPLMICYWKPDDGMESTLNLFFDQSVNANLGSEAAYMIGTGLTQMFEKLALRHGYAV